jgi:hypothetical protein
MYKIRIRRGATEDAGRENASLDDNEVGAVEMCWVLWVLALSIIARLQ